MSRLVVVLDLAADSRLWDPHEAIEDVLAHGETLPTFEAGMSWFLDTSGGTDAEAFQVEGAFVSAEWVDTLTARVEHRLRDLNRAGVELVREMGGRDTGTSIDTKQVAAEIVALMTEHRP